MLKLDTDILKAVLMLMAMLLTAGSPVWVAAAEAQEGVQEGIQGRPLVATLHYDPVSDVMKVDARDVSLKMLMSGIARDTGIEVMFDAEADEKVTVDLEAASLENALKQILKGKSYLLRYEQGSEPKLLIGVMVLPGGEEGEVKERARPIVSIENEAYYRSSVQKLQDHIKRRNLLHARWKTRLNEMSPDNRDRLERQVASRQKKQAAKEQARRDRLQASKNKKAEREAKKQRKKDELRARFGEGEMKVFEAKQRQNKERVRDLINQRGSSVSQ